MEGNTQQYHIRTMARDLERARGRADVPLPKSAPILAAPKRVDTSEVRKLQDILAEARVRVAQAPASPKLQQGEPIQKAEIPIQGTEAPARKTLEDILPIEPLDFARGKPLDTTQPRVVHGPPPNLPTGELSFVSSPPAAIKRERAETEEKIKRTPEEILGLLASPKPRNGGAKAGPLRSPHLPGKTGQSPPTSSGRRRSNFRFVLLAGFLAAVIIGLGYGIYWKVSSPQALPPPPPAIKISEQPLPEALIQITETETIELSALNYDILKPKIENLAETKFLPESLVYIPIKFITQPASPSQGGKETRYLTLLEIFEVLQIDAPPILYSHRNFTLYLYSQGVEAQKRCEEAGIVAKSCYGPRIGIVIKLPDADEGALTKDVAASIMEEWRKTIIDDLGPLMLAVPQKTNAQFARGKYKNLDTSFVNLPISTTSLDWILTDTHLIIATSKDAARAAVDALK